MNDKALGAAVAVISAGIMGFLLWLVYGRADAGVHGGETSMLPAMNATANFLCTLLLVAGYREIRAGNKRRHMACMLAAVACSAIFLAGYITHHYTAGDTPFTGQGLVRPIYFAILISHVVVTAVALPMILYTLARAASGRFVEHRRIARRTLPLWLYVSVTGVLIFVFLRLWSHEPARSPELARSAEPARHESSSFTEERAARR
jgi:putative membrane protein